MMRTARGIATCALLVALTAPSLAQESRWGSADDPVVQFMKASEAKWANAACSTQSNLGDFVADDYQGTSTTGRRYPKADAIADEPNKQSSDCKLGEVWTDTWLKRNGRWQIVAAQDTVIPCDKQGT